MILVNKMEKWKRSLETEMDNYRSVCIRNVKFEKLFAST